MNLAPSNPLTRLKRLAVQLQPPAAEHATTAASEAPPPSPETHAQRGLRRLGRSSIVYDPLDAPAETLFAPSGHCDYYGCKGFLIDDDELQLKLRQIPSGPDSRLASASAPAACGYRETPPALWGDREWAALVERQHKESIFDMDKVRAAVANQDYARDGYLILEGVMTPEAQQQWVAALEETQRLNDNMVKAEWSSSVDWEGLRVFPPIEEFTSEEKAMALGSAQRLRPMSDANNGWAMRLHGTLPEYFPSGHVGYLMFVLFHPQLLELHRLCLQREAVYFGTSQSNSKVAGDAGVRWHSHGGWWHEHHQELSLPTERVGMHALAGEHTQVHQ